jgi:hypothetical protein
MECYIEECVRASAFAMIRRPFYTLQLKSKNTACNMCIYFSEETDFRTFDTYQVQINSVWVAHFVKCLCVFIISTNPSCLSK